MIKRQLFILTALLFLFVSGCADATTATPLAPAAAATQTVEITASPVESQAGQQSDIVLVAQSATATPAAVSNDLQTTLINLYQQVNPAVVYIIQEQGSGSGFLYREDGIIITNNHVVAGDDRLEVVFANGERTEARVIGADVDSDLAVLQAEEVPAGVEPLKLADPDNIRVGEFVIAIGNPFGEQGSMSLGIVSGLGRSLLSQRGLASGSYSLPGVIQTDAPINPGNSGGPLLNLAGEVVGVNSAIASATGMNSGVGFSIPVQALYQIVPGLIEDGEYHYPYLGASFDDEISLEDQSVYGLSQTQGTYVVNVLPSGPAGEAGVVAANPTTGRDGDLIIAIDGQTINDFGDLNSYLVFHTSAGQTIELTLLRGGEEMTLSLTLGERP
jgi:2-alkenal reductase